MNLRVVCDNKNNNTKKFKKQSFSCSDEWSLLNYSFVQLSSSNVQMWQNQLTNMDGFLNKYQP